MICINHHFQNNQTRHRVWCLPSKCPSYFWEPYEMRRRNCLHLHLHFCHQRYSFACRTFSKHNKCRMSIVILKKIGYFFEAVAGAACSSRFFSSCLQIVFNTKKKHNRECKIISSTFCSLRLSRQQPCPVVPFSCRTLF